MPDDDEEVEGAQREVIKEDLGRYVVLLRVLFSRGMVKKSFTVGPCLEFSLCQGCT